MVKLRILSNAFIQKTTRTQAPVNAVKEVTNAPVEEFRLANIFGITPSSAIANITLGLLISNTLT